MNPGSLRCKRACYRSATVARLNTQYCSHCSYLIVNNQYCSHCSYLVVVESLVEPSGDFNNCSSITWSHLIETLKQKETSKFLCFNAYVFIPLLIHELFFASKIPHRCATATGTITASQTTSSSTTSTAATKVMKKTW